MSVPGTAASRVYSAKAVLDSGSGISAISESMLKKLEEAFPTVAVTCAIDPPHEVRVADGRTLKGFKRTCPLRIALITNFGQVTLDPFPYTTRDR